MRCKSCNEEMASDSYVNCADCREDAAIQRQERYALQQYRVNPFFEPRNEKVDGMTKLERSDAFKEKVTAAMTSCPERSMFSPEYESTETYCGLCEKPTLERNLFNCLCSACRRLIRYDYRTYAETSST